MIVLSLNDELGYPQLSSPPDAVGTVTPGVQEATPVTAAQLLPMLVAAALQSVPLQQRLGFGAGCG